MYAGKMMSVFTHDQLTIGQQEEQWSPLWSFSERNFSEGSSFCLQYLLYLMTVGAVIQGEHSDLTHDSTHSQFFNCMSIGDKYVLNICIPYTWTLLQNKTEAPITELGFFSRNILLD